MLTNKHKIILSSIFIAATLIVFFIWFKPNTFSQEPAPEPQETIQKTTALNKQRAQQHHSLKNTPKANRTEPEINNQEEQVQEIDTADNYIVQCAEIDEAESNELTLLHDNVLDNELNENIPEELLAKILFDLTAIQGEEDKVQLSAYKTEKLKQLLNYHQQFPAEPLTYRRLLTECSDNIHDYCSQDFYNKINTIDKNNGALWLTLANIHIKNNNIEEAEKALEKAALSTTFNSYFYETIYLHQQMMKKYLPEHSTKLVVAGIGYSAATAWGYSKAIKHCKDSSISDICLNLGKQMEYGGKTLIQQMLGLGIQRNHHERLGNDEIANKLKIQANNYVKSHGSNEQSFKALNLMAYDETLVEIWLHHALQHGETSAQNLLIEEAIWRSKDPNYNPCSTN